MELVGPLDCQGRASCKGPIIHRRDRPGLGKASGTGLPTPSRAPKAQAQENAVTKILRLLVLVPFAAMTFAFGGEARANVPYGTYKYVINHPL